MSTMDFECNKCLLVWAVESGSEEEEDFDDEEKAEAIKKKTI